MNRLFTEANLLHWELIHSEHLILTNSILWRRFPRNVTNSSNSSSIKGISNPLELGNNIAYNQNSKKIKHNNKRVNYSMDFPFSFFQVFILFCETMNAFSLLKSHEKFVLLLLRRTNIFFSLCATLIKSWCLSWGSDAVSLGVVSWTCDPVLALGQRFDSHSRRLFCCNPLG